MSVKITLTSNADAILQKLRENKQRALTAIGAEAVGAIKQQMASGYPRPVRRTGTLMGDVHSEVDGDSVIIGNSKDYAIYVSPACWLSPAIHAHQPKRSATAIAC